jgi:pyruvate kinase
MIEKLYMTGVDVFRLNFSHGEAGTHVQIVNRIRAVEARVKRPIAVLADLQGPKLRIGKFSGNGKIRLRVGQTFRLDFEKPDDAGDSKHVYVPHPEVLSACVVGTQIMLDDGKVILSVINKDPSNPAFLETKVIVGNELSNGKGIAAPGVRLGISAITEKDKRDLKTIVSMGADWVALSFVQTAEDLTKARKFVGDLHREVTTPSMIIPTIGNFNKRPPSLMAKLETQSAINNLSEVIDASDAVMVARGDLGIEMPQAQIPEVQKRIVAAACLAGKPVTVAS